MVSSKEKLIAKKYADALALVKLNSDILSDLELIQASFTNSKDLTSALSNPSIKIENKRSIIKEVFSKKIQGETLKTLLLLLSKRRIDLAPALADFYKISYYQSENIELAEVESAKELSKTELEEIKSLLEKSLKKNIEVSETKDESLVAGLKIKVANKVIDSSLKTKLKQMKSLLLK